MQSNHPFRNGLKRLTQQAELFWEVHLTRSMKKQNIYDIESYATWDNTAAAIVYFISIFSSTTKRRDGHGLRLLTLEIHREIKINNINNIFISV